MKTPKQIRKFRASWLIVLVAGLALNLLLKPISNHYNATAEHSYFGNKRYQEVFLVKQDTQDIIGCFYKDEVYSGLAFFSSEMVMVNNYIYPKRIRSTVIEFKEVDMHKMPLDSLFPGTKNILINSADNYFKLPDNNPDLHEAAMPYGYRFNLNTGKQLRIIPFLDGSGFYILNKNDHLRATINHPNGGECQKLNFATFYTKKNKPLLVVQGQYQIFKYRISPNYDYYLRYLFRPAIFILIFIFIRIIEILQIRQVNRKEKMNQELTDLQLQSVNNQIDPHFTFNILNTVTGFDWKKENPDDMKKFIYNSLNLFRSQLAFSNETSLSLNQELKFVEEYIRIQQFRYPNIQLEITLDPNLNPEIQIPKTLIFTHAENAVKHGLRPKSNGGVLLIEAKNIDKGLEITITDNGIGRTEALIAGTSGTGTGMRTKDQIINLYMKLNDIKIEQNIEDLNNPSGTRVNFRILTK